MAGMLNVTIHSEASEFPTEKRYAGNTKISELKEKLELITGANHKTMRITLHLGEKEINLEDDTATLGSYLNDEAESTSLLKLVVKDDQPSGLFSGGEVPKYVISDDRYNQRANNARNFIKDMREKRKSDQ